MTRPRGGPPPAGRWCSTHKRHECTKARHGGGPCHGSAIRGTDTCTKHAGKTTERAIADALQVWAATPGDTSVSPVDAASGQLALAWRRAAQLGNLLAEAFAAEGPAVLAGPLAAAERDERDRVVRYAQVCNTMGVHETWTRYAREAGEWMRIRIDDLLARLGVDRRDVGDVIAAWLRDQDPPGGQA